MSDLPRRNCVHRASFKSCRSRAASTERPTTRLLPRSQTHRSRPPPSSRGSRRLCKKAVTRSIRPRMLPQLSWHQDVHSIRLWNHAVRVESLADDVLRMNEQSEETAQQAKRHRPAFVATNATTHSHEPTDPPDAASDTPTAPSNSATGNSTARAALAVCSRRSAEQRGYHAPKQHHRGRRVPAPVPGHGASR